MDGHLTAWRVHRFLAWLYAAGLLALLAYLYFGQQALPPHNLPFVMIGL
jgi:hypothetical protein